MVTNDYPGYGRKKGADYNFFRKKAIVATGFGSESLSGEQPDMVIPFVTTGLTLLNEGSGVVEYSFNGTTVHGELDSTKASSGMSFDNRTVSVIWFRIKSGSTGPIQIRVDAW